MNKKPDVGMPGVTSSSVECDRLYDVLLAKVYPGRKPPARARQDAGEQYPLVLEVECSARGVVVDMRVATQLS